MPSDRFRQLFTIDLPASLKKKLPATQQDENERRTAHAYRLVFLMVLLRPLGNVSLAWGMKHSAPFLSGPLSSGLLAIANPFVLAGVGLLVLTLLMRIATLSIADLSLVLPLTAVGYVVSTALGRFILGEAVSKSQWAGTVLICLGASLVTSERRVSTT